MVITKLIGGLGNQMFQYAAGRNAAHRLGTSLKMDITGYQRRAGITPWPYQLNVFSLPEHFATDEEIDQYARSQLNLRQKIGARAAAFFMPPHRQRRFVERHFHYDPRIRQVRDSVYLEGYWQSEKYFLDIAAIIRQEFTWRNEPDATNRQLLERIDRCNAVSVHIRRGDYVTHPAVHRVHGTCPPEYYRKATAYLQKNCPNPHCFVFSDDPAWVQRHLKLPAPVTLVTHNHRRQDYEDLRLMSRCRHHIIANSTFSWWGAWLATNPEKIVVAPARWFHNRKIQTRDLIPPRWIRL